MASQMTPKRIITTHLWLTLILGVVLGPMFVQLFATRHETDSGFALLAVPYLPIAAVIATIAIATIKTRVR